MTLARIMLAGALALAVAAPAAAEKLSLGAISDYLNGLRTVEGAFTQINADGTIQTGTVYISRPGKVRFEYDPPEETLVLASGGAVAIFDPKGNAGPETYPLDRTPLKIILAENVDLTRERMVTGHAHDGTSTVVTAQDPEHPEYGNIQLVFTGPPVELRQWRVNDDQGGSTTVVLGDVTVGGRLPDSLFNIQLNTEQATQR
jgi:outer membrane lipoprotein-sorting protein